MAHNPDAEVAEQFPVRPGKRLLLCAVTCDFLVSASLKKHTK